MTAPTQTISAQGRVFGGMLLVAGCCIGAGMLALPVLTGLSGFFPSLSMLAIAWGFMTFTGLLLVEIHSWFKKPVNLLTMTESLLGPVGRRICWVSYLFLFYALLVAYTSASGSLLAAAFGWPAKVASLLFAALVGFIVYLGTRPVDLINRVLMVGLIGAYCGMIGLGISKVEPSYLLYSDWSFAMLPLPVLVISFGFQNTIPSLNRYLQGDLKRVRLTIFGGGLLTLAVYVIWSLFVLGVTPKAEIARCYAEGEEATSALRTVLGTSQIGIFASCFAFFAIVTSFLASALTLVHFISDGLKIDSRKREPIGIVLLALVPPALFAIAFPHLFFKALNFAGGLCAMVLFGILPILMVWKGRRQKMSSTERVGGGAAALALALLFVLLVMVGEVGRIFNLFTY